MVELICVIAIITIIVGLLWPSLQRARLSAHRSRSLAQIRQNMLLVSMYAQDHQDVYPVTSENITSSVFRWYDALLSAGTIKSMSELDLYDNPVFDATTYSLSSCMVRDWNEMVKGRVAPRLTARTSAVRQSEVQHPSGKGLMVQFIQPYSPAFSKQPARTMWCCGDDTVSSPVGFADGSAGIYTWKDLHPEPLSIVDSVGYPVISTWNGCRGIDRR